MKIISIKFLNLNSLKGVHEIRFDRPPFTDSGLFAITGPTGAGKTTILDAITVALYARVHRHNRDVFEIMTRHTAESYSEVEFEVREKTYRAKWSLRRSRGKADGTLQLQKMELADAATGAIIAEHPLTQVQQTIVNISGLDYNQFLRSVMLSQGDFTRFLKADENERSELLEKITDTGIYSDISVFTFDRTRDEKARLDLLRNKLNDVPLLTEEELLTFQSSLAETLAKESLEKETKKKREAELLQLRAIERLQARQQQLQQQYDSFLASGEALQPRFEKLRLHRQALKHQMLLTETGAAGKRINEITEKLYAIALQLPDLEKATAALALQLHQAEMEFVTADAALKAMAPVLAEVEKRDVLIAEKQTLYAKTAEEYDTACAALEQTRDHKAAMQQKLKSLQDETLLLQQWLDGHRQASELEKLLPVFGSYLDRLQEIGKQIAIAQEEKQQHQQQKCAAHRKLLQLQQEADESHSTLQGLKEQLAQHTVQLQLELAGRTLQEWDAEAEQFPVIISRSEQQLENASRIGRYNASITELAVRIYSLHEQSVRETAAYQLLQEAHQEASEHLQALQKNLELEMLIQKYEADRKALLPGEPCPLCGATDHPFTEGHVAPARSEAIAKRDAQQLKVDGLSQQRIAKEVSVHNLNYQREQAAQQMASALAERTALERSFDRINESLPEPLPVDQTETIESAIAGKQAAYRALKLTIGRIRLLEQQVKDLDTGMHSLQEIILRQQGGMQQIMGKTDNAEAAIARLDGEIASHRNTEEEITGRVVQLLAPYYLAFNLTDGNALLQQLEEQAEQYRIRQNSLQEMMKKLAQAENEVVYASHEVTAKEQSLQLLLARLELGRRELEQLKTARLALFGEKDTTYERAQLESTLAEKRSRIEELRTALHKKQQALEIAKSQQVEWTSEQQKAVNGYDVLSERLTLQLQADGIPSVEALLPRLLTRTEAAHLEQLEQEIQQEKIALERTLADTSAALLHETANRLTTETTESVLAAVSAADTAISGLNQEIGRVREIISTDVRRKTQYSEIAAAISLQQKETERWNKLSTLIGSADGKKFSRFAQGLTLARLTELANRHLLRLSDRYRILKSTEKDLELQIIDGYQADVVRPMSTLSGGESFLVSLALALGLSDLASRKVQINSLFIDEGFGTLDADTLDVAISALENLQANGKTIGVISHVDALKERIGTQIQVSKQPGGSSSIRLVSYANEFPGR